MARHADAGAALVVGIDGGGTRAEAVVADDAGNVRGREPGGGAAISPNEPDAGVDALVALARRALAAAGARPPAAALCCALAGAGRDTVRRRLEASIRTRGIADVVLVVTDAEAALEAAFGPAAGILVLAGTGSIAWGRGPDGRTARVGGWGPLLGDEGSGYVIGRDALRAVARCHDGRAGATALTGSVLDATGVRAPDALIAWADAASRARIAALAPAVIALADEGDAAAAAIVRRAANELAAHAATLHRRLGPWERTAPLAPAGGLLAPGRPLRSHLSAALGRLPPPFRVLDERVDAARGAAALARRAASHG